jgi:hypothetical protein
LVTVRDPVDAIESTPFSRLAATAALARTIATVDRNPRGAAREILYAGLGRIPHAYPRYESRRRRNTFSIDFSPQAIVIDGFHGSGNSWTTCVVQLSNPDRPLTHHRHRAATLLEGARRGLPCLCLVREPVDAIASMLVRRQLHAAVELRRYIAFYETCLAVADRIEVITFEQATSRPAEIIDRLNHRFAAQLNSFDTIGPDPVGAVRAKLEEADRYFFNETEAKIRGAAPSEQRAAAAAAARKALRQPALATSLAHCQRLHAHYADLAAAQAAR